ncbi:hypothetical protein M514_00414 [Trichuris suis]|uniref:Uncharacterized protein n=1 Tax=Trichuris suis TaxID=68888 RepID=A0A085NRA7_9BILA|nr:hypothetical protein M513_00414 [Trichuris suis]KFD72003.1 hypothetical protein M514_00414 [Trichuris suis]
MLTPPARETSLASLSVLNFGNRQVIFALCGANNWLAFWKNANEIVDCDLRRWRPVGQREDICTRDKPPSEYASRRSTSQLIITEIAHALSISSHHGYSFTLQKNAAPSDHHCLLKIATDVRLTYSQTTLLERRHLQNSSL